MDPFEKMMSENDAVNLNQKINLAIERIRFYAEGARGAPILCAFFGGKDSQAVYQLAKEAGVVVFPQYSITRFEPPELMDFIRKYYPEVVFRRAYKTDLISDIEYSGLPTMFARWCCESKHKKTKGFDHALIGIRWEESPKRRKKWGIQGYKQDKTSYLCPIADWTSHEVWQYIHSRNMPYCNLYDEGFKRIGCVCCPLAPTKIKTDAKYWAKTAAILRRGADLYVARMRAQGFMTKHAKKNCPDWCKTACPEETYWTRWVENGDTIRMSKKKRKQMMESFCLFDGTGFSESDGQNTEIET